MNALYEVSNFRGKPFGELVRPKSHFRNTEIHGLLNSKLKGRPHKVHITRNKAVPEIRILKVRTNSFHVSFGKVVNEQGLSSIETPLRETLGKS